MAFATSQNIDQLLTRGLAFRLPNNAPISSLYTLYANGAGMTFWSNSMNPRDLSTVSTAYGRAVAELSNTVAFQQGEIDNLFGQVSTLSTSMSSLSNWVFDYTNSTIAGLSTFSTFYNDLYVLSNQTFDSISSLSTAFGVTNSTTYASLNLSTTSTTVGLISSGTSQLAGTISSISSVVAYNTPFLSSTAALQRHLLSTSTGLNNRINSVSSSVSSFSGSLSVSTFSTTTNLLSTSLGYGPRISSLEGMSTNLSSISGVWISTQVGVSQSTQDFRLISSLRNLSTLISTVAVNAIGQANQISSISTVLYTSISTNNAINTAQDIAIASLSRNLSILTTSSILAGVYDTFMQLEAYSVGVINSTVSSIYFWQNALYASTIIQTQAIASTFFSTYTASLYLSSVSAVTVATNAFTSTYTNQIYSTTLATANSQTSTSIGVLYSTSYTNITTLNSTQIALLYSTGTQFVLSSLGGSGNVPRSTVVFLGSNAASTLQGPFGIAIGFNAGQSNQGCNAIAIGQEAGLGGQSSFAIALGAYSGQFGQNCNAIGIGQGAGGLGQGENAVGIGYYSGSINQGSNAVGVGNGAGSAVQGAHAVAIGFEPGYTDQGPYGIAIGYRAGRTNQSTNSIAIGQDAGLLDQGQYAIAIGYQAATTSQTSNTIVLNASGTALETGSGAGFFVAPVRNDETVTAGFVHYDTTTKELVYNAVGGSSGGGSTSTFNDILFSTSRGLAVTTVNANSIETAKTNMYDISFFGNTITLVSTLNGGDPEQEGRWSAGPVAMSADGKYQLFGTGIGNSPLPYFPYMSSNYGESYSRVESVGGCNWNGFAMSRSGQFMYMACGGDGTNVGTLFKSADFGKTWGSISSITTNIYNHVACSGDGRYIAAVPAILPASQIVVSDNFGQSFVARHTSDNYTTIAMSLTGQYMTAGKAVFATGLSVSSDFGQTWSNASDTTGVGFASVAISATGQYQVAGHGDNGSIYTSSNYGSNWTLVPAVVLYGTVYSVNIDDTGQYVTASVFNNAVPSQGGILYSSNYGVSYQVLTTGLNFLGSGLSPNAQYAVFLARPSIYRSYIPTRFGAGLSAYNYSPSTNTAYLVNSNIGSGVLANGAIWNSVLGLGGPGRSWEMGVEASNDFSLGFMSYNTNNFSGSRTLIGFLWPSYSSNTILNFTGQHRCFPADDSMYPLSSNIGKVVVATGGYQSMPLNGSLVRGISSITISESLPLISLARNAKDKRCFGVICDVEDFNDRKFGVGCLITPYPKTPGDTRIYVNSLGEGAIWVCDINGPVENGDYLTSSDVPGYAMKQGEEYIANYTVAKATIGCDFADIYLPQQVPLTSTINGQSTYILDQYSTVRWVAGSNLEPLYQLRYLDNYGNTITKDMYEATLANGGVAYRAAFIGCTYHCG